jgi:hypothetical protein
MSDRSKHLGLAIVFTVLTLWGASRTLGMRWSTLGAVTSPPLPNRWGNKIAVVDVLTPLAFSTLASSYCWWAYLSDRGNKRKK